MKKLLSTLIGLTAFSAYALDYDKAFPYNFEYCAATQVKYQDEYFDGSVGGVGGHATIYVQGLCKDYSKGYPTVIPCHKVKDIHRAAYPHDGVGISLDSDFSNIMWIAVPGRELFYGGKIDPMVAPNEADLDELLEEARRLRVFEGAQLKADFVTKHDQDSDPYLDAAATWATGTDIALNWGRDLRCVKTPIKKEALQNIADYLNYENEKYRAQSTEYNWSFIYNNCTHLSMNAAHAAGLSRDIETDRSLPVQLFNLAVPANVFMLYADDWVLKKFNKSYLKRNKDLIEADKTLPLQMGSLLTYRQALPSNFMFKNDKLQALSVPRKRVFKMFHKVERYDEYFQESKYTELGWNLAVWEEWYMRASDRLGPETEKNSSQRAYIMSKLQEIGDIKSRATRPSPSSR